jgi:S-disulfanyl-L-cysteine oxidoreductase SoxD
MNSHAIATGFGVAAALSVAGFFVYQWLPFGDEITLRPDDQSYVARGQELYRTACSSCHGVYLEGQANWRERGPDGLLPAPPHDPSGHTWHHPDEVLFDLTKFGVLPYAGPDYRSAMPAFEDKLSDEDILAILSYIKSTWPAEVRRRQDAINEASRKQQHG